MKVLGLIGQPDYTSVDGPLAAVWTAGWYHNSSAALLEDDRITVAIEEERLSRRKHSGKFPVLAIRHCLQTRGLEPRDIDAFAFGEFGGVGGHRDPTISTALIARALSFVLGEEISSNKVVLVDHHLAHAWCGIAGSSFTEGLVLTLDGFGDDSAGLLATFDAVCLTEIRRLGVEQSLGRMYSSALRYLGFGGGDEYKMMGLAPLGQVDLREPLDQLLHLSADGQIQVGQCDLTFMTQALETSYGPRRAPGGPFLGHHATVAASLQHLFEVALRHVLDWARSETGLTNVVLSGGASQNSVANGRIRDSGMFEKVYVPPACHDAGLSVGAAVEALRQLSDNTLSTTVQTPELFLGSDIPGDPELIEEFSRWSEFVTWQRRGDVAGAAAAAIVQEEIIGWFQGRAEFGPRALGHRSILADPRRSSSKARVNLAVKQREEFRPFAPAVTAEASRDYFELSDDPTTYREMTFVAKVRHDRKAELPATTHVDGSARVQVVTVGENGLFHRLLRELGTLTGVPVVLNTSFNHSSEPMVETVRDAMRCFLTTDLDALFVGDFEVRKRAGDLHWESLRPQLLTGIAAVAHTDTSGVSRYALLRRGMREEPISRDVFLRLTDSAEVESPSTRSELFRLWANRLIDLVPPHALVVAPDVHNSGDARYTHAALKD